MSCNSQPKESFSLGEFPDEVSSSTFRLNMSDDIKVSSLEECLNSVAILGNLVDSTVDDCRFSISKKSRDIITHINSINDILMQIGRIKEKSAYFAGSLVLAIHDIECQLIEALNRFRKIDFLKGVHISQKPRMALQKKKTLDEITDRLRIFRDRSYIILGRNSSNRGESYRCFVSEEEVMNSINSVLGDLFCHRGRSVKRHVTPIVVWVLVCRKLGKSLQELPMKVTHHHYINNMISRNM
ncbi:MULTISPECIES: hypothetical protein [Candidatus Ichthyocystis]|uniref:Uncharacterized protein n=1 Tax=Candidatus Ichthyocystis hellenicum TaxID=1561003 RepID=A0A0S4M2Y0_9BURK|nr:MULTISPECIES: hypothetical protein [Ichthyocystis]CUT18133.1 hypothetical protein Ark11_1329 [Candidatus Ichthyocystis hellenicum]